MAFFDLPPDCELRLEVGQTLEERRRLGGLGSTKGPPRIGDLLPDVHLNGFPDGQYHVKSELTGNWRNRTWRDWHLDFDGSSRWGTASH
jgi:hypothetical protein